MTLLATMPAAMEPHGAITASNDPSEPTDLLSTLAEIEALVPPLWPLKDYVAVNPFLGLSGQKFLEARSLLRAVRDGDVLPPGEYFHSLLRSGRVSPADLAAALAQCREEYPIEYQGIDSERVVRSIEGAATAPAVSERCYFTVAEVIDREQEASWASHIANDITRHAAAHYDEGQAAWPNPWRHLPLYQAWRESVHIGWRMDMLGIRGFRRLVDALPESPPHAIAFLLRELAVPPSHWRGFLLCQLFSVAGWASYARYRGREAEMAGGRDDDLLGLLVIRLAYDVALVHSHWPDWPAQRKLLFPSEAEAYARQGRHPSVDVLARYAMQVAAEVAHRRDLVTQLLTTRVEAAPAEERRLAQLVFCIDVRSEVMRRHLESLSGSLETFGFAGFFAMPFAYVPLGQAAGVAQCPVLLSPGFSVGETVVGAGETERHQVVARRGERRVGRKVWKSFQTSAVSCFSFVESLGLWYLGKLLTDTLGVTRPVSPSDRDGLARGEAANLGPDLPDHGAHALSLARKTDLAEGMLRNLGLVDGFARLVVICGHTSEVVNTPYKAGLDCGACGGHSGEPNARVAAGLANDARVRGQLAERGIHIPDDTWFVPAVHVTSTDEIRFFDTAMLPASHAAEFEQLRRWTQQAGQRCREERSRRMSGATPESVLFRSRDWSEVRPEWGLAGNAAFIVAPRSRTARRDLGGRAFLHSYDESKDAERKTLELIMTAPMIVTSWINLQYYASSVDNRAYGSGNKAIHNVVGQFGVLQGNGGDLMTGLPWQSVHDGEHFQHEPLRLLVAIEAQREAVERILAKHQGVRDLVSNGWISLAVLENERLHRWTATGTWEVVTPA